MKPVRKEILLKSESAKDTVLKAKKKEYKQPSANTHKPGQKSSPNKPRRKGRSGGKRRNNRQKINKQPNEQKFFTKKRVIGTAAIVGAIGATTVYIAEQGQNTTKQNLSATSNNNDDSTLGFGTSSKTKRHSSDNRDKNGTNPEKKKLNNLLNDTKGSKENSRGNSSDENAKDRSASKIEDILNGSSKVGGAMGNTLKQLLKDADKSTALAAAIGNPVDTANGLTQNADKGVQQTLSTQNNVEQVKGSEKSASTPISPSNTGIIPTPIQPSNPAEGITTPTQPSNPGGGTTTPIQPSNPGGGTTTPIQPSNPGGGTTTPTEPSNPGGGTTTPTEPSNPGGGTTTPTQPEQPDSSSTPGSSAEPGSSSSSEPGSSAEPGSSSSSEPGSSAEPGSSSSSEPGSSAEPGSSSSSEPGSSAEPGSSSSSESGSSAEPGSDGSSITPIIKEEAAQATTGLGTDASNNVPLAENVEISYNNQGPQKVDSFGTGFNDEGQYVIKATVDLQDGSSFPLTKTVTVTKDALLNDADINAEVKQTLVSKPITIKTGDTLSLFDSYQVTAANDAKVTSNGNNGGIVLNQPGKYRITFRVGSTEFIKDVTVQNSQNIINA